MILKNKSWPRGRARTATGTTRILRRGKTIHDCTEYIWFIHHYRHRRNRRLLSAIPVAEEVCLSLGPAASRCEFGALCMAAFVASNRSGSRLCRLRWRLRDRCAGLVVAGGWGSASRLGFCRCGCDAAWYEHHHVRAPWRMTYAGNDQFDSHFGNRIGVRKFGCALVAVRRQVSGFFANPSPSSGAGNWGENRFSGLVGGKWFSKRQPPSKGPL